MTLLNVNRHELSREKRAFIRTLFEAKPQRPSTEIGPLVKEKFGSGICVKTILDVMHEVRGTKATTRPRKKVAKKRSKRKAKSKPEPKPKKRKPGPKPKSKPGPKPKSNGSSLVALPITVQTQSSVEVLVKALVRAMRDEGIESLTVRADGRGRAYQLVERDLDVGV